MDTYDAFHDLESRWNRGEHIAHIPTFDEDDREYPIEEQLSIQSISGQTPFMRGVPEECAGEMNLEDGDF